MKGEMDTVDDEEENKRKGIPQGSSPDNEYIENKIKRCLGFKTITN